MINKWIIDIKQENFYNNFLAQYNISEYSIKGYIYSIQTTPLDYSKYVYINTIPAEKLNESEDFIFKFELYGNILNLSVYEKCADAFNIKIIVKAQTDDITYDMGVIEREYNPYIMQGYNEGRERYNKMINSNVSYQLLRTNPKLTGNIKVVVTENSDLYLDTFKVSLALGQYKYRHVPINPNEYYGMALMRFRKMSTDDFYKVEDNCFNLFTTVNDYKMQYYTMYNSGVKTNDDNLYTENYALLAPLCVKEVIPDFFLIFKVDTDILSKNKNVSESEKIKYFLKNGKLVKSFDFREGTNLGKYIRGIRENAEKYPGDVFASYDTKNYNKFIGISIDRGVVTSAYESLYKEKNINNQVALNEYYTLGFERNKLVSKDIINFEFMFNDTDENLFSINTYFGLYVTLNGESNTFSCIGHEDTYIFDEEDLHIISSEDSSILKGDYANLIYGVSTPDKFIRLNESIYDSSLMDKFMLKPYKSIVTGEYRNLSEDTEYEYISFVLNKNIKIGEHYRVIDLKNAIIYDVISTNRTKYLVNNLSEVCYNYVWYRRMRFTIKTISAFFEGNLENQVNILSQAFRKLEIGKSIVKNLKNALSIKTYNTNCIFEKVSSVSDYRQQNKDILLNYTDDNDSLTFFGYINPNKLLINASDRMENDYFYLYPYYTESTGYRLVYVEDFIKVSSEHLNHAIISDIINEINNKTIVYLKNDNTSELYKSFNINTYTYNNDIDSIVEKPFSVNYLLSPDLHSYIINVNNPKLYNDTITLYNTYPINSGLCSILPLKDFYFDVLDSDTKLNYYENGLNTGSGYERSGEFRKSYTNNDVPLLNRTEEYVTDYFDKGRKLDTLLYKIDEDIIYNNLETNIDKHLYYSNLLKENHIYSDISLISPYVCKWKGIGTDARGEQIRIMYSYDPSVLNNALSYYIPYDTSDVLYNDKKIEETQIIDKFCEQPGFVESNNKNFIKYINGITNTLLSTINGEGVLIKDAILSGRISVDDILYYNSYAKNKFSTVYKSGDNAIEFVSGGIKIKVRSTNNDVINFNTYGGFQAVLISVPGFSSEHNTKMEFIIDEVNKQMILIWYTGTNSVESNLIKPSNIFKVLHTSPLYESKCVYIPDISSGLFLQTPNDTNLSKMLCNEIGYLILMNKHIYNNDEYSNNNDIMIISQIPNDKDILYYDASYITTLNPVIISGKDNWEATNSNIKLLADDYHDGIDMYIVTDSDLFDIYSVPVKSDLKNDFNNCGIYVRKAEGIMDYTNLSKFLTFTLIPPYKVQKTENVKSEDNGKIVNTKKQTYGFVQTIYTEPVTVDKFVFKYKDDIINNSFKRILDGMNVNIAEVKTLSQTWVNKYTTSSNYCIPLDSSYPRISLDCLTNMSIMDNCWSNVYRDYNVRDFTNNYTGGVNYDTIEWYDNVLGYQTGYEKKNYLGSRGINLNGIDGDFIDLGIWKNTKIIEKDKCIKLDISESLIYKILFAKGFSNSWKYLGLRSNTHKIKYIKNTILPLLNITSNTLFTFYVMEDSKKLAFKDLISLSNITQIENIKNELRYENGKYYMYVYPKEAHTYYAKMHIKL